MNPSCLLLAVPCHVVTLLPAFRFSPKLSSLDASNSSSTEQADGWRVVDDDYGQAVGKLQAESMMSTAASLFRQ
jgi:hypothetical protein